MDRIDSLLQTLLDQRASNASAETLLSTISLLQFELQKGKFKPGQEWGTSKVSVLLPSVAAPLAAIEPSVGVPTALKKSELPVMENKPVVPAIKSLESATAGEVNDSVVPDASLNDRLRNEKPMLAETMQGTPIKDLRKGISLNERYQLVKELFEGDESRFDKAIKTINSFSILAEAQFWMDKELRSKPGWQPDSAAAKLLNQLVKRRFS